MPKPARVAVSDAELDAALGRGRLYEKYDRRATKAGYSKAPDRLRIILDDGATYTIPRSLLQGLSEAFPKNLRRIEIVNDGTGLLWPSLDVTHYVPALVQGVYGSEKWMSALFRQKRKLRVIPAPPNEPANGKSRRTR